MDFQGIAAGIIKIEPLKALKIRQQIRFRISL